MVIYPYLMLKLHFCEAMYSTESPLNKQSFLHYQQIKLQQLYLLPWLPLGFSKTPLYFIAV